MTETGEKSFERFSAALDLRWTRIAEASDAGEQRPDYEVVGTDGSRFIAEIKLITPTEQEAREIERVYRGESFATSVKPGERLRRLIGKANQQLKSLARACPGVLVVFNPEFLLRRHTDPYAVLTAMRGFDVVDVHVPHDPRIPPQFGSLRSGPGKKMTADANTSTSAVMCPIQVGEDSWHAAVYHNRFAAYPLPPSALPVAGVAHFVIAADERDWNSLDVPSDDR